MSILTQNTAVNQLKNDVSCFFSKFNVGKLLYKCNSTKEKGISPIKLLKYKVENIFNGQSMYMQQKLGSFREDFSKNSFYRFLFLSNPKTNWEKFTTALSKKVADAIRPLTIKTSLAAAKILTDVPLLPKGVKEQGLKLLKLCLNSSNLPCQKVILRITSCLTHGFPILHSLLQLKIWG